MRALEERARLRHARYVERPVQEKAVSRSGSAWGPKSIS